MREVLAGLKLAQNLKLSEVDIVSDNVEAAWSFCSGGGASLKFLACRKKITLPLIKIRDGQ